MSYLKSLWLLTSIIAAFGQNEDDIRMMLDEAVYDVLGQHSDEMSSWTPPPDFNPPDGFMRSFMPGTGVGNREDLSIDAVRPIRVFHDTSYTTRWQHKRFNNSDFLLGVGPRRATLHKVDNSAADYLALSADEALFDYETDSLSVVKDVAVFERFSKFSPVLYVAILTESARSSVVYIYEIIGQRGAPVGVIDLGLSPATSLLSAKKLAFVRSERGESLVVLIDSPDIVQVVYQQRGSYELNHYIEVHYPSAVDIEAFTVNNHGYLAFANASVCDVIRLDEFAKGHVLFDRIHIPLGDAVDLASFRLGFHHYLAVSGANAQYLYVHRSGEFAPRQNFAQSGLIRVYPASLPTCRDDVVLFFIKDDFSVDVFVLDGRTETFLQSSLTLPPSFRVSPHSVTSFVFHRQAALLFLDPQGTLSLFLLETSLRPVTNPVVEAGKRIADYMRDIQDTLQQQSKQVQTIRDKLRSAVRTSGDQRISAFQTFTRLHSLEGAVVTQVRDPVEIVWEDSELTLEQYREGTGHLEQNIRNLEALVQDIERIIPDVVRTDEKTIITGSKRFAGDVSGPSILALSVNLQNAAGIDLPQLQRDVYRLDRPQRVQGSISFPKPLTIVGNLDVGTTVNGIDVSSEVMTTDTEQISEASMVFRSRLSVQGDLHVSGKVNGLDLGEEVVTLGGAHNVTGRKTFLNGVRADGVFTDLLDGVDMDLLYQSVMSKTRDQMVSGTKTFSGGLLTNDIVLHGYLNGHNITELAQDIVRVDRPSHITGHKAFLDDVSTLDSLTVAGTVNGLRVPDDLFLTDVAQTVHGFKQFDGVVTGHNVIVNGTVDDIVIPDDVITLTGDEEVHGDIHFTSGIDVQSDIIVEGHVDGVDISEVAREALKLNESHEFKHGVFFGPVTITGDLLVGGTVNKVNLKDVVGDIVYKDDENVVVESQKTFKKVVAEAVQVEDGRINGYNLDVDFMTVNGDQVITGTKTFTKPVTFSSLTIQDGMVGTLNVNKLYESRLTLIVDDEDIETEAEFADEVVVEGNLVVKGLVNGLSIPGDVVLRGSTDPVTNKVFVGVAKVENLVVGGDATVSGTFGGVDLEKLNAERISLDQDQELEGDLWLGNSVVENLELAGLVNGVDLEDFARNVMSKTRDQEITGEKVFKGTTIVQGPVTTVEGINGINLKSINDRAFKLHGADNYVTSPLQFDDASAKDVRVDGFVSGINLTHLALDGLKKTSDVPQHVIGTALFKDGFDVQGDIDADTVNDLVLADGVLLKDRPQTITGQFTLGSLHVSGDLNIDGRVNGLDLSAIRPDLARKDQSETVIESDVTFTRAVHVRQDVRVSGLVNGIDLNKVRETLLVRDGDQYVSGSKVIRGTVTVKGDVEVEKVNGVDWSQFLADVVRTDIPQVVKSPKTFVDDVEVNSFVADAASVGLLNGRRLEEIVDDAVLVDVPTTITGPKVFQRSVEVNGDLNAELINGLRLKTDVITLTCNQEGPQVITGQKTFENVTSFADIEVGGTVNGYKLYDLFKDTLLTEGDQAVSGKKYMTGEVTFSADVIPETVNGLRLRDELVTLDTDQELEGPVTFTEDVLVGKNLYVHGLVNGVDVAKLAGEAVYLSTDDIVSGSYHLESAAVTGDVSVRGLVNGVDLPAFDVNVTDFWTDAENSLAAMDRHSGDNCELVKFMQGVLSKSYYILDSFVTHQVFRVPASHVHVLSPTDVALVFPNDEDVSANAVLAQWNASTSSFVTKNEVLKTTIAETKTYRVGKAEIGVYVGMQDKSSFVQLNGSPLQISDGFSSSDVFIQSQSSVLVALLFPRRGTCEVFRISGLDSQQPIVEHYGNATVGKGSTSVAVFEISEVMYLAASGSSEVPHTSTRGLFKILERDETGAWQRTQRVASAASTYVRHILYHGYHYLVINDVSPVHESREPKSIQIYRNSAPRPAHFGLFQKLPFDDSAGIESFHFASQLHLVSWNRTLIQVWRLDGEAGFRPVSALRGTCVKVVRPLLVGGTVYLMVGQHDVEGHVETTSVLYKGLTKGVNYIPKDLTHC